MKSQHLASLLYEPGPFLKLDNGLFPSLKHVLADNILWPGELNSAPTGISVPIALRNRYYLGQGLQLLTLRHYQVTSGLDKLVAELEDLVGTLDVDAVYPYPLA